MNWRVVIIIIVIYISIIVVVVAIAIVIVIIIIHIIIYYHDYCDYYYYSYDTGIILVIFSKYLFTLMKSRRIFVVTRLWPNHLCSSLFLE